MYIRLKSGNTLSNATHSLLGFKMGNDLLDAASIIVSVEGQGSWMKKRMDM